jgi:serine/threonine-protein kinase
VTRSDVLRLTTSASVFGTPLYMSPEQIMSSKKVDTRTDQHAMAMVLFELLTKHPPYFDESPTAVTVKIATLPPPSARSLRADIPPALDGVIMKALGKAPADRFDDIAVFALALAPHGSARADTAARRAAAALNRPAIAPEVILPPAAVARSAETVTGLATKRRIEPPSRSKWGAVAIGGAALAGIVGAALVYQLGPASQAASGRGPAAATETATAEPARTTEPSVGGAPSVTASATPSVEPTAAASSSAEAAPSATATAPKIGKGAPAKPKPSAKPTAAPTGGGEYIPKYK